MISVKKDEIEVIKGIVLKHLPCVKIMAFGSRVNGQAKPHSDLDIALDNNGKISGLILAQIENDFEESSLPFRVDIIDWHHISQEFKELILNKCKPVWPL